VNESTEWEINYQEFIKLERGIEANKEYLQKIKTMTGLPDDVETIYQNVITNQERLLRIRFGK